jgi:hypothetical protein
MKKVVDFQAWVYKRRPDLAYEMRDRRLKELIARADADFWARDAEMTRLRKKMFGRDDDKDGGSR